LAPWTTTHRGGSYSEGFTVEMTVRDSIEVVGGPLSGESQKKRRRR
jgi:hypothetical protein